MGHHENIKTNNNRDRRRRSTPSQKHRIFIQQNYRKKLSQSLEGYLNVQKAYRTPNRQEKSPVAI